MTIILLFLAATLAATVFVILFRVETAAVAVHFDNKYKKILDEAATLAATESVFDTNYRDNRN